MIGVVFYFIYDSGDLTCAISESDFLGGDIKGGNYNHVIFILLWTFVLVILITFFVDFFCHFH